MESAEIAKVWLTNGSCALIAAAALQRLDVGRRERILRTVKLARDLGASTAVLSAQGVAPALVEHARRNNLSRLVLGHSSHADWWPRRKLGHALASLAPGSLPVGADGDTLILHCLDVAQPVARDLAAQETLFMRAQGDERIGDE